MIADAMLVLLLYLNVIKDTTTLCYRIYLRYEY